MRAQFSHTLTEPLLVSDTFLHFDVVVLSSLRFWDTAIVFLAAFYMLATFLLLKHRKSSQLPIALLRYLSKDKMGFHI